MNIYKGRLSGSFSTHRIRHCNSCVGHESDFAFTCQIYIHNSVAIKADLQFLVRPQVVILSVFIRLTNNTLKRLKCSELHIWTLKKWTNAQL